MSSSVTLRWFPSLWLAALAWAFGLISSSCSYADEPTSTNAPTSDSPSASIELQLERRFRKQIYPLLTHDEKGCVECHNTAGTSNLVLSGDARSDFRLLLDEQYFKLVGADTLLNRLSTAHVERRMPKEAPTWNASEIQKLTRFLKSVKQLEESTGVAADERFPRALLDKYTGPKNTSTDNQFITYHQLRGKVKVQFADDWVRDGRDGFAENLAMFGGADFKSRFNESSQPSAAFLTALETMAREVSARAFDEQIGPFQDWPKPSARPEPVGAFVDESLRDSSVSESESGSSRGEMRLQPDYRSAIDHLYQRILFRPASQAELVEAYSLIRDVYGLESTISARSDELRFELTVTDPETMLQSQQLIRLPVDGDPLQVQQLLIDQTQSSASSQADNKSVNSQIAQQTLAESIWLEPGVAGQRVALHNLGTFRNVSFIGLDIYDVDSGTIVQTLSAEADKMDKIELDGAWQASDDDGISSFEDRNQHKGLSLIRVPLMVERAGAYKLVLRWRANPRNANNVLVELFSPRAGNTLVSSPLPVVPPKGQAQFYYDCSEDARAFFAPAASFQFDEQSLVRIANDGTLDQVTAGAIEFTSTQDTKNEFLIDSLDADGNQPWSRFDEGRFKAYNVKGTKLHDDNKHKGERELLYRLATKRENGWQPEQYYSLRVYYPGKRDQEAQVPLTVHAHRSSPIIQVAHPRVAKADATVHMDASNSYTVSHAPLQYHWRQTGGTRVELADATSPKLTFVAPRRRVDQAAWVALCAALVRHPDFLFTRPTTLFATPDSTIKSRLQLVKLALDLVGRSPTQAELNMLTGGSTLSEMADRYLASEEFKQFYFHRIRLHLESQGTDVQDEPARLWCHVAFNERPFQEILTADYTADAQFQKQERPSYHGRTGVLTTRGFIQGKPGLPHYNYAAQVSMLFLGYVYEVPPEIVELREGVTALGTTDPNSVCYSCHKILTPLAFQRSNWTDDGDFRLKDEYELPIDASDRGASVDYPFTGSGLEAFATQAARKERFIRTIINTHVNFYFGRPLRHREDERELYRRLWEHVHETNFQIPALIRAIVTSPEYLEGRSPK